MDNICRLCASHSSSSTYIFSLKNGRIIADMITSICPIKLDVADEYPKRICNKCLKTLIEAVHLREKSVECDENFKSGSLGSHFEPPEMVSVKEENHDPFTSVYFEDEDRASESHYEEPVVSYDPQEEPPEDLQNYQCKYCPEKFENHSDIKQHYEQQHSTKPMPKAVPSIKCTECGLKIAYKYNFKRHFARYHDPNLPLECNHCTYRFSNDSRLKTHVEMYHRKEDEDTSEYLTDSTSATLQDEYEKSVSQIAELQGPPAKKKKSGQLMAKCQYCGIQIAQRTNLRRHIARFHASNLPLGCTYCTYRFESANRLKTHMEMFHKKESERTEDDMSSFLVDRTSALLVETNNVEDTIQPINHQALQNLEYICDKCGQAFSFKRALEIHIFRSHDASIKPNFMFGYFPCDKCEKTFSLPQNLAQHCKQSHSAELPFRCRDCNDRFKDLEDLIVHKQKVHDSQSIARNNQPEVKQVIDTCQFCNANFKGSKYRLERHMIANHEDELEKILECHICRKKFVFARSFRFHLEVHRKKVRQEKYPFKCTKCTRMFLKQEKLDLHMENIHKTPSTYICYICGKIYTAVMKSNFELHMKVHMGIKDFPCSKCDMKFVTSTDLARHFVIHCDDRPFECKISGCGKSFKRPETLRRHKKSHRNDED